MDSADGYQNRILQRLSSDERARFHPQLEPVRLSFKEPLVAQRSRIDAVYFVNSGVISIVTDLSDGNVIETETIGREGLVGLPALFGLPQAPWRAFCQIPGSALRCSVEAAQAEAVRGGTLGRLILRFAGATMTMVARSAACNRAHPLEQRMARWLLMTRDRVDSDEFPLTQEFLGQMLGVRRPTISLAGGVLQRAGLIRYSRGKMTIVDRQGLEEVACECYDFVRREFDSALGEDTAQRG